MTDPADLGYEDEDWVGLDQLNAIPLPQRNGDGPEEEDSWTPINLGNLPEQPPVQPTLGDVGLVYPGKRHVFSGPQESAKTLAAYAIGLQIVRAGHPLVIIDFEMGRWDARNRLRELGATPEDFKLIHYLEPHEPATSERIQRLVDLQPALVIIDAAAGAYDLQSLDDNKRQDVERFTRLYVKAFWKADIATIVLDHVVKDSEARGSFAIGSERKIGGADVHLGFEAITPIQRGQNGLYKIVTHKDRGGFLQRGKLADLHLTSDPDTHAIGWEIKPAEKLEAGEIFLPTTLMSKVSTYLSVLHEPVSRKHIEDNVIGQGKAIRQAIDQLTRLGYTSETDGPRGAKLVTHERLFHENDLKNTDPEAPRPTSSHLVPDGVVPTSSSSSPPEGGDEVGGTTWRPPETTDLVPPQTSWLDELEPDPEEEPT